MKEEIISLKKIKYLFGVDGIKYIINVIRNKDNFIADKIEINDSNLLITILLNSDDELTQEGIQKIYRDVTSVFLEEIDDFILKMGKTDIKYSPTFFFSSDIKYMTKKIILTVLI